MYWNLYYSTRNIACLNTTKDIANPNSVSNIKMYYYVISFVLSTPMAIGLTLSDPGYFRQLTIRGGL